MNKISNIGICLRPWTPQLSDSYCFLKEIAKKYHIEVKIDDLSAKMINVDGVNFDDLCRWCDILITLGGDGTLISTIRKAFLFSKPILGVNTGRLGFLTAININEIEDFIIKLKNGTYITKSQILLEGEINDKKIYCANEFLITKRDISGMIKIIAKINGKHFNTYFSDGLIIGTPAGSTAHNLSAGGAIIYPYNRNILLTPICAHSFTQRPLVLSDEFVLDFEIQDSKGNIVIDGQEILPFCQNDRFRVFVSSHSVSLVYDKNRDYFEILRDKFNWGV